MDSFGLAVAMVLGVIAAIVVGALLFGVSIGSLIFSASPPETQVTIQIPGPLECGDIASDENVDRPTTVALVFSGIDSEPLEAALVLGLDDEALDAQVPGGHFERLLVNLADICTSPDEVNAAAQADMAAVWGQPLEDWRDARVDGDELTAGKRELLTVAGSLRN